MLMTLMGWGGGGGGGRQVGGTGVICKRVKAGHA
jgi:hypothetical protein